MVDPNVYALSVQLSFEATDAFKTLDDFGQKLTDLEDQVSTAAQKAIQSLSSIAQEANKQLVDIGKMLGDIQAKTLKVETNLGSASKELKTQFDTGEERLEDLEKELKIWTETYKLQGDLGKELQTHLDLNTEFLSLTNSIIGAVKQKNAGHALQNDLLQTDRDLAQGFNNDLKGTVKQTDEATKKTAALSISWHTVWGWIKKADEDTEKFTTTNYRHYGSQQQLVQGARELAMVNGIAYENAIEAYAVLGNLKVPRDELDKYAKAIAQANRSTGVGIQVSGEYVNRMRVAGLSLAGAERGLAHMGEAMRKFGLNTRDVNALMNQSAANAKNAAMIFGKVNLEEWNKARDIMSGFAREAGHGAEEMAGFENWILNDIGALERFNYSVGVNNTSLEGFRMAFMKQGIAAADLADQLEAARASGSADAAALLAQQQQMIETMFGGNRAAYEAAMAQGRLAKQYSMTGASIDEVNKLTELYSNTIANQQAEANRTFTAQMKILWSTITAAGMSIMQFVADGLLPLITALNWLLSGIATVVGWVAQFIRWMESIPYLGKVITFLKWGAGVLLALGLGFLFVSGAVISLGIALGGFSGLMGGLAAGVQFFAAVILVMARVVGQVIVILLTSIGKGLQALGNSVSGVMLPLLALGAALMMAGIGAYFFAMGVQIVAEMGWSAIPALIGMIVVIGLLGLVLVGLAMLVQGPVAIGLVVLAIAILAVGVAALMMGAGIYMAALGFQILSAVLTFELIAKFAVLGAAIVALGAVAMLVTPGLYAFAIAMVIIAVAAIGIAVAFYVLAAALKLIGTDAIPALGNAFMTGALYMLAAGGLLIAAAALLTIAAVMLVAAVALMLPIAAGLVIIGLALLIGGTLFAVGSTLLLASGVMLLVAGVGILIGGASLFAGLLLLSASVPMMLGVGLALAIGSVLMQAGAASLLVTSVTILAAGLAIFAGGYLLYQAGVLLVAALPLFVQAGAGYIETAFQMFIGSVLLAAGGAYMVVAGALLLVGGAALLAAGVALAIGLFLLSDSSATMYLIGTRIGIGGLMMLAGAQALVTAAGLLGDSAGFIDRSLDILKALMPKVIEAANAMLPAGLVLQLAAFNLLVGCLAIAIAGIALNAGASTLLYGAIVLGLAVQLLGTVAGSMLLSATSLAMASMLMLRAVGVLMMAGSLMAVTSTMLLYGGLILLSAAELLLVASLSMVAAGALLWVGATALLGAVLVLMIAATVMVAAATTIFYSSLLLAVSGSLLPAAAQNILAAMVILSDAGHMAVESSSILVRGAAVLGIAASSIIGSAWLLEFAGERMRPTAFAIYTGLLWLEFAISRFSKTTDKVEKVGASMSILANSFQALHNTPMKGLREMTDEALGAVPNIEKLGDGLMVAAKRLDDGVRAFQSPAERLNTILKELTETVTAFGQGLNLTEDVGKLADMLDNYARLLENASERIEVAVATKAMPAIKAAENAGVEETIRSEAISTVQVIDRTDGAARDTDNENTKIMMKVRDTLVAIDEKLGVMQSGGRGELADIVAILQAYLPGMSKGDSGLGSELNSWNR